MANTIAYFVTASVVKNKSYIVMTNTLAYYVTATVTKQKSFIAMAV
jgi:hypothetical protein